MRRPKNAYYYFPLPLPSSFFFLFSFLSPCLLLLVPSSRAGCGALNTHPAPFFFPPGGCDALNTLLSLSLSFSLFLSLFLCLSLFRPFLSSLSFFPSLGYFLYFLFARLGMACSSSASLPSRPLSSTRSRSFCAGWGCCPRKPETWLPRCSCFLFGVLPAETQLGAFLFLLGSLAPFVFCWGLRPVLGRVVFSPPEKVVLAPH